MSIASEINRIQNAKLALKEAIEAKGVTVETNTKIDEYPALVNSIPQGGGSGVEEKDVNFYDYDGTCVYAYTKDEFLALEEMPENINHNDEDLISEGYTYTIEEAKSLVQNLGGFDFPQWYHGNASQTKLYFDIDDPSEPLFINIAKQTAAGTAYILWGDGDRDEITTEYKWFSHLYSTKGRYIVTFETNNTVLCADTDSVGAEYCQKNLLYSIDSNIPFSNAAKLKKVIICEDILLNANLFFGCQNLNIVIINSVCSSTFYRTIPNLFGHCESLHYLLMASNIFDDDKNRSFILSQCHWLKVYYYSFQMADTNSIIQHNNIKIFYHKNCHSFRIISNYWFADRASVEYITSPSSNMTRCYINAKTIYASLRSCNENKKVLGIDVKRCNKLNVISDNYLQVSLEDSDINELDTRSYANSISLVRSTINTLLLNDSFIRLISSTACLIGNLYITSVTPPTLSTSGILKINNIFVPAESVEDYKTATNWSAFADKIFPIPTE